MDIIFKAFGLANKNLLPLFIMILIYAAFISISYLLQHFIVPRVSAFDILFGVVLTAFWVMVNICIGAVLKAGFFNIIKSWVYDKTDKSDFLGGVSRYYLPILGIDILFFLVHALIAAAGTAFLIHILGGFKSAAVILNIQRPDPLVDFTSLIVIGKLYTVCRYTCSSILFFIFMYLMPVLYINYERNIFKAMSLSVKYLFKNFWKSLFVYAIYFLLIAVLNVIVLLLHLNKNNIIINTLCWVVSLYTTSLLLLTVFLIYKQNIKRI